jgi:transposase-like protein
VDETYIGGYVRGKGQAYKGNKTMVIGAIEREGKVRLATLPDKSAKSIRGFVKDTVADDAEAIFTDESQLYGDMNDHNTIHARVKHSKHEWVRGDIHTNTVESVWSLFDRGVIGAYHKLSPKHLPAYLDEFAFRFNNRNNPYLFRDTILALVEADALTFRELVGTPVK